MSPLTYIAIYFICWWVVLFPVLSLGSRSHSEAGLDLKDGGDPGAPVLPNLKRKFITTSWVAAILFAVIVFILLSGVADSFLGLTR
jgi:predicted secreted protein